MNKIIVIYKMARNSIKVANKTTSYYCCMLLVTSYYCGVFLKMKAKSGFI